ncbi:hypothetical protein BSKO_05035 [Bryopsis sp. KO-2023]|nr:hypothetical protein BSKO_05035 [Bryopsis sp. KO-2023]
MRCSVWLDHHVSVARHGRASLVVVAASKKGKAGGRKGGKSKKRGGGRQQRKSSEAPSPLLNMSRFRADEKLLFEGVPGQHGALDVVYAYPNEYSVGITSLGYQLVWANLSMRPDIKVARLFTDAHEDLPMSPGLLGFSLSWELDYANMLSMLEKLGIPILAADRGDDHPLVFGGGPVLTGNPEPYAAFMDVVLMGDGENLVGEFLDAVLASRGGSGGRMEVLRALSQVPGVYVPALFHVEYSDPCGPISSVTPISQDTPQEVIKQTYRGKGLAASTVVSSKMAWENIFMVEVVRSCPEMCRFCSASYLSLPFRPASLSESLIPALEQGLGVTDRLGLLGASVTQHPEFPALIDYLLQPEMDHVRLSIASVRTNTVTPQLTKALASRGTKSLTVAVESGSERVRRIINKKLDQDDIAACVAASEEGGLEGLKFYGMVGLPGEEVQDVEETVSMMEKLKSEAPQMRLSLGVSTFVPKSHTPFQWYGVSRGAKKRMDILMKSVKKIGVEFRPESHKWSIIQALLSRGDRRLTHLLLKTREYGDSLGAFRRAFNDLEGEIPPLEYYVYREIPEDEVLPWDHIIGPLRKPTLEKHRQQAVAEM